MTKRIKPKKKYKPIWVDEDTHDDLKIVCAKKRQSMNAAVREFTKAVQAECKAMKKAGEKK